MLKHYLARSWFINEMDPASRLRAIQIVQKYPQ